jgi:hypothetical protein
VSTYPRRLEELRLAHNKIGSRKSRSRSHSYTYKYLRAVDLSGAKAQRARGGADPRGYRQRAALARPHRRHRALGAGDESSLAWCARTPSCASAAGSNGVAAARADLSRNELSFLGELATLQLLALQTLDLVRLAARWSASRHARKCGMR